MGEVIELSPKFVDRWARRYILLYRTEGGDTAKRWAVKFLPGTKERNAMIDRVNAIIGSGG